MDVCMWVLKSRPAWEGWKKMSGVLFHYSSHVLLRQSLFLNLGLHSWTRLEASMSAPGILLAWFPQKLELWAIAGDAFKVVR